MFSHDVIGLVEEMGFNSALASEALNCHSCSQFQSFLTAFSLHAAVIMLLISKVPDYAVLSDAIPRNVDVVIVTVIIQQRRSLVPLLSPACWV